MIDQAHDLPPQSHCHDGSRLPWLHLDDGLTRAEGRILIEGRAESNTRVSKFMRNIESSGWLHSPTLSFIQADTKDKKGELHRERMIGFNLQAFEQPIEFEH